MTQTTCTNNLTSSKSGGLLRAGVPVKAKYVYIHREEGNYPIRLTCRWSKVSCSGYYPWQGRGMSETQKRREELAILVKHFSMNPSKPTGIDGSTKSWNAMA